MKHLLDDGRPLRTLVRSLRANVSRFPVPGSRDAAGGPPPDVIWGDIRDPAAVTRLLQGADLVFHLAAHARAWAANPKDFEAINVEGTRNVASAALTAGVRRVVHVSTELVDGDETLYQRSKRGAEQVVHQYLARGGDAVIVRPTRVYGPGPLTPANSVTRIIALYRRGLFRLRIADGGARANYVYVDDVVDGLLAAAERGARGAVYLLGGENLSLEELTTLIAEVTGRRHGLWPVPRAIARLVGAACELGGRLGIEPMITRQWVTILTADRPISSDAAVRELAYHPRSARDGIAATVAWPTSTPSSHGRGHVSERASVKRAP
ncbi:MAG: NAD-dependent epimerase/dehydratase family protein [Gemmatimonadetes bacterium]|nr:NAD-dependent epimerase/dehydratase family protein [Gemmatimonadota bacterium]